MIYLFAYRPNNIFVRKARTFDFFYCDFYSLSLLNEKFFRYDIIHGNVHVHIHSFMVDLNDIL